MSDWRSSLGPQGRGLLNLGRGPRQIEQTAPQELDFLVNELRNPKSDATVQKTLGYLYHYMPQVKIETNMRILFSSFLNNPTCFGQNGSSFEAKYLIIEVFKLIADKKLKVSNPTLNIKTWYGIILKELRNFVEFSGANSWKVLPVLAGLFLSKDLRDRLYSRVNSIEYGLYFKKWDDKALSLFKQCLNASLMHSRSKDISYLSLVSYAVVYRKSERFYEYTPGVAVDSIIRQLLDLTFSLNEPYSMSVYKQLIAPTQEDAHAAKLVENDVMSRPVLKHLNKLSSLLEVYFEALPYTKESYICIMNSLMHLQAFNKALAVDTERSIFNNINASTLNASHASFWLTIKGILFAQIMIYQGILTRFVKFDSKPRTFFGFFGSSNASFVEFQYQDIALKVLHNLYYLNFILISIGQGGFDSYNFVYYVSLEIANVSPKVSQRFEWFTEYLIGNYTEINMHPDAMNSNYVMRSKVSFTLGLWENYLQVKGKDSTDFQSYIFECSMNLVNDKKYKEFSLVEAAHSVLLVYFSKTYSKQLSEPLNYITLLIDQFPTLISPTQLSIAIETIGKSIMARPYPMSDSLYSDSVTAFLHFIYDKCFHETSGFYIPGNDKNDVSFVSAQPIQEIQASSSLKAVDDKSKIDIVSNNKSKKPKDLAKINLLPRHHSTLKTGTRKIPVTTREAMITSMMNLIPYIPLHGFVFWLDKVWVSIEFSSKSEQEFLIMTLWRVISENLDLNRCGIAMSWWYESKKAVEENPISISTKL